MSEEDGKVSIKILSATEKKFREYQLDKKLQKDQAALCKSKNEAVRLISQRIKVGNTKIVEYERKIKQWRKKVEQWNDLIGCVNPSNEDFLVNALLASEEDLENFEKENFLSNANWTKMRKVSELSEQELRQLKSIDDDENFASHSEWIRQNAAAQSSSVVSSASSDAGTEKAMEKEVEKEPITLLGVEETTSAIEPRVEKTDTTATTEPEQETVSTVAETVIDPAPTAERAPTPDPNPTLILTNNQSKDNDLKLEGPSETNSGNDTPISDTQRDSTKNLQETDGKPVDVEPLVDNKSKKPIAPETVKPIVEETVGKPNDESSKPVIETSIDVTITKKVRSVSTNESPSSAGNNENSKGDGLKSAAPSVSALDCAVETNIPASASSISEAVASAPLMVDPVEYPKLTDPAPKTPKKNLTFQKLKFTGEEPPPPVVVDPSPPTFTNVWTQRLAEKQEKEKNIVRTVAEAPPAPKPVVVSKLNPNAEPFKPMFQRQQEEQAARANRQNGQSSSRGKKNPIITEQPKTVDADGFITPKKHVRQSNGSQQNDFRPKEYRNGKQKSSSPAPVPLMQQVLTGPQVNTSKARSSITMAAPTVGQAIPPKQRTSTTSATASNAPARTPAKPSVSEPVVATSTVATASKPTAINTITTKFARWAVPTPAAKVAPQAAISDAVPKDNAEFTTSALKVAPQTTIHTSASKTTPQTKIHLPALKTVSNQSVPEPVNKAPKANNVSTPSASVTKSVPLTTEPAPKVTASVVPQKPVTTTMKKTESKNAGTDTISVPKVDAQTSPTQVAEVVTLPSSPTKSSTARTSSVSTATHELSEKATPAPTVLDVQLPAVPAVSNSNETTSNGVLEPKSQSNGRNAQHDNDKSRRKPKKARKENNGISHEEMIAIERKKKADKKAQEYKDRQTSMMEIRQQRERDHEERRNQSAKEVELQRHARCLERVHEHEKTTDFHYRYLAAVLHLEARSKDIAEEDTMLSKKKLATFKLKKSDLDLVIEMSSFILFIRECNSEKENKFTLSHLVSFLDHKTIRANMPLLTKEEKEIQEAFSKFEEKQKSALPCHGCRKKSTMLIEAFNYAHGLTKKLTAIDDKMERAEKAKIINVFDIFTTLQTNAIDFVNKLSYLHRERKTSQCLMEEDLFFGLSDVAFDDKDEPMDWECFAPDMVEVKEPRRARESDNCNKENLEELKKQKGFHDDDVVTTDGSCQTDPDEMR